MGRHSRALLSYFRLRCCGNFNAYTDDISNNIFVGTAILDFSTFFKSGNNGN